MRSKCHVVVWTAVFALVVSTGCSDDATGGGSDAGNGTDVSVEPDASGDAVGDSGAEDTSEPDDTETPDSGDVSDTAEFRDTTDARDGESDDAGDAGDTGNSCSSPDPSGCDSDADCAAGEECKDDPNSCDPSSCTCSNGTWLCTRDCGGTVCQSKNSCSGPDPSGCDTDADCAPGEVCKDDPNSCDPSSCTCSDGSWTCTADCGGTVCMST